MSIPYSIKRSGRKTMALEITPEAQVLVRAPLGASLAEIQRFVSAHTVWIEKHLSVAQSRMQAYPMLSGPEQEALKTKAKAYILPRVEYYAAIMGLFPAAVTITGAKKRFGSCSAENRLCFSLFLMRYPEAAIDYVVVHELAHIRHKNHGKAFYACIASVLPDYRERRMLLKS